jgi:hypothetical protein
MTMKIKLLKGFKAGMVIEVTDNRAIAGIGWIGGKVLYAPEPYENMVGMQYGTQYRSVDDYEVLEK